MDTDTYTCPCCLTKQSGDGFYDICSRCGWECDGWDLDEEYGPNGMTLREGRENYAKYGNSNEHCEHEQEANWCRICCDDLA